MAGNGGDRMPEASNFLETIEESGGDSGTSQAQKDKENPGTAADSANTKEEISTASAPVENSGIVETLESSDGYGTLNGVKETIIGGVEHQPLETKEDQVDIQPEKTQSIPEEGESRTHNADLKKDGWNAEDPSHHIFETIDPQSAFPDPPIFDPDSLQTADVSNPPPNVQVHGPVIKSTEITSLDISEKKTDSLTQPQNNSSLDGISEEPILHVNSSRRQSKDSLDPSNLNANSIRNRQSSRSSTILKPKSSLREPEYTHQREEFLDSNMLISNTKLDGLLFRLFSLPGRLNENDKGLPFVNDGKSDIISMDPVLWHLRPMTAVQKETLDSEMEFLEDTLMPKQIVRQLFMDGILTHMDYNQIMRTEGQGEKAIVRLLIGTLKRRGEKAFPLFMKALKDLHHSRIWERLDATERSLNESLADDQRKSERRSEMEKSTTRSILKTRFMEDEKSEDILREFLQSSKLEDAPPMTPLTGSSSKVLEEDKYGPEDQKVQRSSPSNERLQSRQLEQQLDDINTELKALHEGLNLLQSARSSTGGGVPQSLKENTTTTPMPLPSVDPENPNQQTPKRGPTDDTELSNKANDNNSIRKNNVPQKSGTCVIL